MSPFWKRSSKSATPHDTKKKLKNEDEAPEDQKQVWAPRPKRVVPLAALSAAALPFLARQPL